MALPHTWVGDPSQCYYCGIFDPVELCYSKGHDPANCKDCMMNAVIACPGLNAYSCLWRQELEVKINHSGKSF